VKAKPLTVTLVAMAAVAVVLLVLASRPKGPPWVPEELPREDRRVVHPLGFSVVKPPGWCEKLFHDDDHNLMGDAIYLLPTTNRVRFRPYLRVNTFTNTPADLSNYHGTRFLDMDAYEKTVLRAGNGDYFTYELYITNHSRWYRIIYQIPADSRTPSITSVPETMLPYIQSFKAIP
jgi:hypothetical protein